MVKVDLLIIDPQKDFCNPDGALFVPGADDDCVRLATMLKRVKKKVNDIHVTLDTHHLFDIAHPLFWINDKGEHPTPIMPITVDDVKNGVWKPTVPTMQERARKYVEELEKNNRYILLIWFPHCLIGSPGAAIQEDVYKALTEWEEERIAFVDYVTKGSNFWTEHYSAVKADVPDPSDPSTQLNINLINTLQDVEMIGISGQARSHCVANTIRDIADNFGEDNIHKFVLLEDTCSDVPGFENLGEDFVKEMVARGMRLSKSTDFLA